MSFPTSLALTNKLTTTKTKQTQKVVKVQEKSTPQPSFTTCMNCSYSCQPCHSQLRYVYNIQTLSVSSTLLLATLPHHFHTCSPATPDFSTFTPLLNLKSSRFCVSYCTVAQNVPSFPPDNYHCSPGGRQHKLYSKTQPGTS